MHDLVQASAQYIDADYQSGSHEKYILSIQLRLDGFSFAIICPEQKKLLQVKDFRFIEKPHISIGNKWHELQKKVDDFLHHETSFVHSFQKVIISIDHKEYTMMPMSLYIADKAIEQLIFNQEVPYPFEVFSNTIPSTNRRLISAIYKPLNTSINDYFDSVKIVHTSAIIQNEVYKMQRNTKQPPSLFVSVSNRDMHIVCLLDGQLRMSNSFSFTSKEDFVYFILLAYDQLKLNPEEHHLYFLGDITKSSPIYQICWQYIRNIFFIDQTKEISASAAFDQMPIHQYFILIQSALCE